MPRRSKFKAMPKGSPLITRVGRLEARADEHEVWLEIDDERLNDHETVIAGILDDITLLKTVGIRSRQRSLASLKRLVRRAKKRLAPK